MEISEVKIKVRNQKGKSAEPDSTQHEGHDCIEIIEQATMPRPDLKDSPIHNADYEFYVDGSSRVVEGKRKTGYPVVTQSGVIEARPLPPCLSAQGAELTALTAALQFSRNKRVNIYSDSKKERCGFTIREVNAALLDISQQEETVSWTAESSKGLTTSLQKGQHEQQRKNPRFSVGFSLKLYDYIWPATRIYMMSGKKVLIVYAHQEPKSMNGSLKNIAEDVLQKQGCSVFISDLYSMNFNAAATRKDIAGELCNPQHFSYGAETMKAFKKGSLCEDILKEQKKVHEADLVIFQFPLYWFNFPAIMKGWIDRVFIQGFAFDFPGCYKGLLKDKLALLSFTTGGTEKMFSKDGVSGNIRYLLWPMQHGIMHFCGFKVLAPQISYATKYVSNEKRKDMLMAWQQRLENIWDEKPIECTARWYFQDIEIA
ncbi:ribosyldihydronicotinamide dehydrogenase [quinone] [Pelodytes ibericus]